MVVGISQTAEIDPLDEDWSCEAGGFLPNATNLICRGFWWEKRTMHELPTLGGNHGFATGVNSRGQIVGWAETAVHDPTCTGVQQLQFRAVDVGAQERDQAGAAAAPRDSTSAATASTRAAARSASRATAIRRSAASVPSTLCYGITER
jgi:uncharacterized membrane protein